MMTLLTESGDQHGTCDEPAVTTRFTERELSAITQECRALPGKWTAFPHVDSEGEVTLLLSPDCWEERDIALLLQRDAGGITVLMSVEDDVTLRGTATSVPAAMAMVWDCACRHTPELADMCWPARA